MTQKAINGMSDIGGHPLKGGRRFSSGLVFRVSGGMVGATELDHLDAINLRVLVDLRGPQEDRSALVEWAASRGVRYHNEAMALGDAADLAAVIRRPGLTEAEGRGFLDKTYRRILDEFSAPLCGAVSAIASAQPAAFGCAAGKDRAGLLTALVQDLLGVDRSAILAGYVSQAPDPDRLLEALGTWLDCEVGDLSKPGVSAILGAVEEVMAGALDYLDEKYGGTVSYFEAAGLPAATIDRLRDRLVADEPTQPYSAAAEGLPEAESSRP